MERAASYEYVREQVSMANDAPRFCCFARVWWGGAGIDAASWVEQRGTIRHLVIKTGEVHETTRPKTIRSDTIGFGEFEAILAEFSRAQLGDDPPRRVLSHYDTWFGFKEAVDLPEHWLFIQGGHPSEARLIELENRLHKRVPSIL